MPETWVWSLGWEDPLEEGMATHSNILAWRIPTQRGTWWATVCVIDSKELDMTEQISTAQWQIILNIFLQVFGYLYIAWCSCSVTQLCPTLWDSMDCSTPGLPVHHQHPARAQTHVNWVSDAIQPSHPLLSPSPSAFNLSQHQVFSNESVLRIRWPKYWNFSFSISPFNDYSGLISFRIDWFDLLAVQGTLKSLLQHHSSKASILWCSAFFMIQLSRLYMTTGKTIALTIKTFVGKVMSLFF